MLTEKLKVKIAELLLRGIAILVWNAVMRMPDGETKALQQGCLAEINAMVDHLKDIAQ